MRGKIREEKDNKWKKGSYRRATLSSSCCFCFCSVVIPVTLSMVFSFSKVILRVESNESARMWTMFFFFFFFSLKKDLKFLITLYGHVIKSL